MNDTQKILVIAVLVAVMAASMYVFFYKKQEVSVLAEQEISMVQEPEALPEQEPIFAKEEKTVLQEIRSKEDFEKLLARKDKPLVVKFATAWCPPCKALKPIFENVSELESARAQFATIDVDNFADKGYVDQFSIQGVPTIIVFNQGKEADRIVGLPNKSGLTPKQALQEQLSKHWRSK